MIKLKKVVLINWMYFQKVTLNLEGNAAIVGVNGTGKSTIIDALQMLILGNRSAKFNANANAEKRTLESYVRGAISIENKPFLREGDVVSYLAIEIEKDNKNHIFGINMEYQVARGKLNDPRYFYMKGLELTEDLFVINNFPKTYDDFSKSTKNKYDYTYISTLFQYQLKLKDILGLKDEKKYFQILSRAVGIKNITNCNDFMNNFVLDENPIDVVSIKNNIQEFEKLNKIAEKEESKYNDLSLIVDSGINIEENQDLLKNTEITLTLANRELKSKNKKNLENENIKNYYDATIIGNNIKDLDNKIEEQKDRKREFLNSLENISPDIKIKKSNLEKLNEEYDTIKTNLNFFKTKCEIESVNLKDILKFNNKIINSFIEEIRSFNFSTNEARILFKDFKTEIELKIYEIKLQKENLTNDIKIVKEGLIEIKEVIKKLENNQASFKKELVDFVQYLKNALFDKYNKKIEIKFLCEYLEIIDDDWRNAIEGYLGNQRFYIVVPNEYYDYCLRLYNEKKTFYNTRIINGSKLPSFNGAENTLGSYVKASNPIALNYSRYILNRVFCVNNLDELKNYDISITKECMLYQNYSVGRINPNNYREQFIGITGLKNQLEVKIMDKSELNVRATKLASDYYKVKSIETLLSSAITFASKSIEDNTLFSNIDEEFNIYNKINNLTQEISFYESNPKYIEINIKISEIDKAIENLKIENEKIKESLTDLQAIIKRNDKEIEVLINEIDIFDTSIGNYDNSKVIIQNEELFRISISEKYIIQLNSLINKLDKDITINKTKLENEMKETRNKYGLSCEPTFENLIKFRQEKIKINSILFEHKNKLIEMKKRNCDLFFTKFISGLNRTIESARTTIKNLNHSLSVFLFGSDWYKIKDEVTKDKDFELIYNYARIYNQNNATRDLLNFDAQDPEREKIMELLNQYMFSDDIKLQNMIVDYRNFMHFDVISNTPNGTKSLNEVMKTQSGGEVQVPFYILSGVAFQQTLDFKRNKDGCLGIVLYDEAFDKMDSQRIQSMLQFYKEKLSLQLIIATPGKLDSLADNVETILAVIRDGECAIVSDISHEL